MNQSELKIDLSRFRQTFFQEAGDHIQSMEAALLAMESAPQDPETLNGVFRAAHSIKGGSATFGFGELTRFTHRLEELLDRMRQGKVEPSPDRIQLLLQACDVLRGLLSSAENEEDAPANTDEMFAALTLAQRGGDLSVNAESPLRKNDPLLADRGSRTYTIRFAPSPNVFREGMDPLLVLRELADLGTLEEVVVDLSHLPELGQLQTDLCFLCWSIRFSSERPLAEIEEVFAFVREGAEIAIEAVPLPGKRKAREAVLLPDAISLSAQKRNQRDVSIRVDTAKVDHLINLVGELVIAQSMAVEIAEHFTSERLPELQAALIEVSRNTRELQDRVMGVRMLPVGTVFARLPRIVHDVATASGKAIRMELAGEDTELDKAVLESMIDPLTHLVRNAADHGIESLEERRAAGKDEEGSIRVAARHQAGGLVIEVSDDGRGLNTDRIREKALQRGLLTGSEEMTPEQIHALVFQPGFSTKDAVSEVSGRGVGMDVVYRNVDALGGLVTLQSREGEGTTVRIKLPLTLAILDGQLVRVGRQTYVLPLVSIVESIRPTSAQICNVAGAGEVVILRGEPLPLLRLHKLFGIATEVLDPCRGLVAILENENRRYALLVDELLSQQQVVIKNLQTNFRRVEGAMGATILGDGCVSLILDVAGLEGYWRSSRPAAAAPEELPASLLAASSMLPSQFQPTA